MKNRKKNILALFFIIAISPIISFAQGWQYVGQAGFSAGASSYTMIAIDKSGTPYTIFSDAAQSGKSVVMKYDGSTWTQLGNPLSVGANNFNDIVLDSMGYPIVVFQDGAFSSATVCKRWDGNTWQDVGVGPVSSGSTQYCRIALDKNGTPYVVYRDGVVNARASVKMFDGTSWQYVGNQFFTPGSAHYTDIVVDTNNVPYVGFRDISNSGKMTVMKYDGSSWVNVGSAAFSDGDTRYTSLALYQNRLFVGYVDNANGSKTTVKEFDGTQWVTVGTQAFSPDITAFCSIDIDSAGTIYIAFAGQGSCMKYDGTSWVQVAPIPFTNSVYPNMCLSPTGIPYVVYSDHTFGDRTSVVTLGPPTTTISTLATPLFSLAPNPITQNAILKLNRPLSNATLTIVNYLGQEVWGLDNVSSETVVLSRKNLPNGNYVLRVVENGKIVAVEKIVLAE